MLDIFNPFFQQTKYFHIMVAALPEFYARKATLDDLKYAQQATNLFNTAYGSSNSMYIASLY